MYVCVVASVLALSEYSELKDKYEEQLQLNKAAEKFAHEVFQLTRRVSSPLMPTVAIWVQLFIKHPVPDRVKPSFVIFDIRAL